MNCKAAIYMLLFTSFDTLPSRGSWQVEQVEHSPPAPAILSQNRPSAKHALFGFRETRSRYAHCDVARLSENGKETCETRSRYFH